MRTETGMSFAADYRWRAKVSQQAFNERYYPYGREDGFTKAPKTEVATAKPTEGMRPMPSSGSINFHV
ncbi:hypothetical protein HYT74_00235 [Candidatus Daviesbacteria bacterium]|nr:hypothetical protein [Candidatus Daviesbacteria bacterium]